MLLKNICNALKNASYNANLKALKPRKNFTDV